MENQNKLHNRAFWKRMLWFGLLNVAVVTTLLVLTQGNAISILPFLLLYSCTMPFISLYFSILFIKRAYHLEILEDDIEYDDYIEWYRQTTYDLAQKANLPAMPQIAIYDSYDPNAFATGRSKKHSLIAVSTALLHEMTPDAVEAVIAHEIAHIVNGDMVTQTLLQSFLNIIVSTVLLPITLFKWFAFFFVDAESTWIYWLVWFTEWLASLLLLFAAGLILKKYSRQREFAADHLASHLTHPHQMISALQQLEGGAVLEPQQKKYAALQFNGQNRFADLFSTHPSIHRRITYLQNTFSS